MVGIEKCKEKEIRMSDKARPWDMINGSFRVLKEVIKERLDICDACSAPTRLEIL
jgi:hypothetical protein